jgi:glycosyltransferase involved in cell wall biosynthesis
MIGVAIVIPMLNEAAGLPRVLRSLAALEPPPAEALAVDGGSTDASVAIAEAAGLLVVRHETRGRAAAINRGVQEATAPIICVLHADTLLPDDAVAVMEAVIKARLAADRGGAPQGRARARLIGVPSAPSGVEAVGGIDLNAHLPGRGLPRRYASSRRRPL